MEVERELYGLHSFNFMASKADKILCGNTLCLLFILYHLVFMLGLLDNIEHNTGNKFDEDPEGLSKQVTYHALRAGHEIVRKEEEGAQVICLGLAF